MSSLPIFFEAHENPAALTRRRFLAAACAGAGFFLGHPASRSLEGLGKFPEARAGTPEGLDRVPAFPLLHLPGEGTDPMHPLPPAVPGRARRTGRLPGAGEPPGGLPFSGLRQSLRRPRGPGGKEALFPPASGQPLFFHRHRRLQSSLQVLPELGDLPGRAGGAFNFDLPPQRVASLALEQRCASVASTYVEPTIFIEYMIDVGKAARPKGILNTCHSNGYINPQPLNDLITHLDAACIDLKGFREEFYPGPFRGDTGTGAEHPESAGSKKSASGDRQPGYSHPQRPGPHD